MVSMLFSCSSKRGEMQELTNQEPYSAMKKHTFALREDCFIYQIIDATNGLSTDLPYNIGICNLDNQMSIKCDESKIGTVINNNKIISIIPKGTEFRISKVISQEIKTHIKHRELLYYINVKNYSNVVAALLMKSYGASEVLQLLNEQFVEVVDTPKPSEP